MNPKIKDSIERSIRELKNLENRLSDLTDDIADDLPDDIEESTRHVRAAMKKTLSNIGSKLDDSMSKTVATGERLSEEAELQAHLGLMEAQDKLQSSKKIFEHYLENAEDNSKTLLDELELKAHLAKMEAEDFWEKRGPDLSNEFSKSADTMVKMAEVAANEIQEQFSKWNMVFSNRPNKQDE